MQKSPNIECWNDQRFVRMYLLSPEWCIFQIDNILSTHGGKRQSLLIKDKKGKEKLETPSSFERDQWALLIALNFYLDNPNMTL